MNSDYATPLDDFVNDADERMSFFGQGSTFFGIVALNLFLTIITLGIYYPWAKAAYRKYMWNEAEFKGSRFVFNGTGWEMFKGFIIVYFLFLCFFGSLGLISSVMFSYGLGTGFALMGVIYLFMFALIPFAIFGGWRYRVSRTSWRGIFFAFDGRLNEFMKLYFGQFFLTLITFGIYAPWMSVKIQQYLFSHTRIGNLRMDFHGDGWELFKINFLGVILMYLTLFLYVPIWIKERFNFTINNTSLQDGEKRQALQSTLQNGEAWKTQVLNVVMLVCTFGLAFPWTMMRTLKMFFNNIVLPHSFDYDSLEQADKEYKNAVGDEMLDVMDIGLDF